MSQNSGDTSLLNHRLRTGDPEALARLFDHCRVRLQRMIQVRMDPRLRCRVDASDVLQEAYLDVAHDLPAYLADGKLQPMVWLRLHVRRRLMILHRHHLGTRMRDARQEVASVRDRAPEVSSVALAMMLLGRNTSPSQAVLRAERLARVQEAVDSLDPLDREILALRHFKQLGRVETAELLGINPETGAKRYFHAIKKLKVVLANLPGGLEGFQS